MPYARDLALLIIGIIILRKKVIGNSFVIGLVLIMYIFSPLFDIVNNYSAFVFGVQNDFNALKVTTNTFFSNLIGVTFSLFAMSVTFWVIKYFKGYPLVKL
jgi:hypothetical protein